jgi:hypothetical protein
MIGGRNGDLRAMRNITGRMRGTVIAVALGLAIAADLVALVHGLPRDLFWAYLSVAITLAGYAYYVWQMYPQAGYPTVKPEPLTWALFGFLTSAGWIVQQAQGGAAGSWCLGVTALACFVIALWSYLKFDWTFDRLHMRVAIGALVLFVFSFAMRNEPAYATLSAVAAAFADFVSYFPSVRKAYHLPREESVTNLIFNSVKAIPALLALDVYNVATTVYLLMLAVTNGAFALYLVYRRHQVHRTATPL